MKTKSSLLFLLISFTLHFALRAQEMLSKTYNYENFTELEVSHTFIVEVTQGDIYSITVEYAAGIEDNLDVSLSGEELNLGIKGFKNIIIYQIMDSKSCIL